MKSTMFLPPEQPVNSINYCNDWISKQMSWKDLVRLNLLEGVLPCLIDRVEKTTSTRIYFTVSSEFYGTIFFTVLQRNLYRLNGNLVLI